MKNVLIYGAYGLDNLGDDYMMYQINKFLNQRKIHPLFIDNEKNYNYFDISNIDYISQNPLMDKGNKIVRVIKSLKWLFNRKDFMNIDAIIFMGGGYTNENFSLLNLINIYLYALKFKLSKKKIYFTGQTVGPYNTLLGKVLIKKIYKLGNKIFVREQYSKKILDDFNIKNKLVGDDAFLAFNDIKQTSNNDNEEYLIINYKVFKNYEKYEELYFKYIQSIAKKINLKIVILPFRSRKDSNEVKVNYKLYEYLKKNDIKVEFCIEKDIKKFNSIFKNSKMVIGTAYHSIVLGLLFGNTVYSAYLGNYYKMKIDGILDWYGYNKNCFNLEDISTDNLLNEIDFLDKNNMSKQENKTIKIANNVMDAWNEIVTDIELGEIV